MEIPLRRRLQIVTAMLALAVAGIHLLHPTLGGPALVVYLSAGQLSDPRPLAFVLGSFVLLFGVLLGINGFAGRALYLGGILIVLAFFLGYGAWHTVLDHGGFWPHIEGHGHHGGNPIGVVFDHLVGDLLALVSTVAEAALFGCLTVLYYTERTVGDTPSGDPRVEPPT